eukprot:GILI01023055.1.p1 GENE.GILI01023055.1~~GILI01023055.1.p1  ORF type:complete len:335 (+),score=22.03 GILI01023055.1:115-1005(+)
MPKWGEKSWLGVLAPGEYKFPFAFRIPFDALPTMYCKCFENDFAEVRYVIKAKFHIPFRSEESAIAVSFRVSRPMPISQSLAVQSITQTSFNAQRYCCCCCPRGFTQISFSVDKDTIILAPGNAINGKVTVDNSQSSADLQELDVSLVQQTIFTAKEHERLARRNVSKVSINSGLSAGQTGPLTFEFQLPTEAPNTWPLLASNFKGQLITNTYYIRLSVNDDWYCLGQAEVRAAGGIDNSNTALPVQVDTVLGATIVKGEYPRFLYAPPPNSEPEVPLQVVDIGPFVCCDLQPIPY